MFLWSSFSSEKWVQLYPGNALGDVPAGGHADDDDREAQVQLQPRGLGLRRPLHLHRHHQPLPLHIDAGRRR